MGSPADDSTVTDEIKILNDRGLHTRPATELVKCASRFKALIHLRHRTNTVNAKSLLGVLTLNATKGTRLKLEATGPEAQEAVDALKVLAANQFNFNY
jgi:phosphocarrier protein HPr